MDIAIPLSLYNAHTVYKVCSFPKVLWQGL